MTKGQVVVMDPVNEVSYCDDSWYLVHCKSRQEQYATDSLRKILGIQIFFPQYQASSRRIVHQLPFFPGYIFALANLQNTPASRINSCPGVICLVGFSGSPQPVPLYIVESIQNQLDKLSSTEQPYLCPGDSVRIRNSSLQDLEMIFVGPTTPGKRVRVLLHFLGRLKEIHVEPDMLEKVANDESKPQQDLVRYHRRYTRGKGRRITHS
jgi:transcription antitermination factor NusG